MEGLARLWGIWDYVDPKGTKQLEPPTRPAVPKLPAVENIAERMQSETDEEYSLRLQQHRLRLELLNREYAINQDRFRIDCLEYSIKLGEHGTAKEELNQTEQGHLLEPTPRLKLMKLEMLLTVSNHTVIPDDQVAELTAKLECKGDRDWIVWMKDVAELWQRCFDSGASKNHGSRLAELFIESARGHHDEFCLRWREANRKEPFEVLIQDFILFLLLDQDMIHDPDKERKMAMLDSPILSAQSPPSLPSLHSPPPAGQAQPAQTKPKARRCPGRKAVRRITGNAW
ncbi:Uncharacterized protein TCAP_01920 [Tolypocladium capitatum]|uniref:Uncharacterized protein n=1 Tax=Tolypocladium capitatum TaxID=45235 RepID=A0A2K3QKV5_9HYPO|nr:Uncharacterized protein TCAP_01920 [Tolypocladium capitatum]